MTCQVGCQTLLDYATLETYFFLHKHCASLPTVLCQQLEGELKKLQAIVQEGTQSFDEVLMQLFMSKVQAELAVFQVSLHQSSASCVSHKFRIIFHFKFHFKYLFISFQVLFMLKFQFFSVQFYCLFQFELCFSFAYSLVIRLTLWTF